MLKSRAFKYQIGHQYKTRGKNSRLCTIVDRLTTTNEAGEVVKLRYVSVHEFLGQSVYDYDVVETTVTLGS